MAELTTTVHSPIGPVFIMSGRLPKQKAVDDARKMLRRQIAEAEAHLAEFDNWTTTTERGNSRAKTYEEMTWGDRSS